MLNCSIDWTPRKGSLFHGNICNSVCSLLTNEVVATDSRDTGKHTHAIHDTRDLSYFNEGLSICLRVYCACAIL